MMRFPYVLVALAVMAALCGAASAATNRVADDDNPTAAQDNVWFFVVSHDLSVFQLADTNSHESTEGRRLHKDSAEDDDTVRRGHGHDAEGDRRDRHGDSAEANGLSSLTGSPFDAQFDAGLSKNSQGGNISQDFSSIVPLPGSAALAPLAAMLAALFALRLRRRAASKRQD